MTFSDIPMVPSLNNAYPSNKFGRRFKSKEYRLWERSFDMWVMLNKRKLVEAAALFAGVKNARLSVVCTYHFCVGRVLCLNGNNKRLDLDNRAKPLLDAITKAIGFDDSSIWQLVLYKKIGTRDFCEVQISESFV